MLSALLLSGLPSLVPTPFSSVLGLVGALRALRSAWLLLWRPRSLKKIWLVLKLHLEIWLVLKKQRSWPARPKILGLRS
jgi:hypothetical protein